MLLKYSCSQMWSWEPEICNSCSFVRLSFMLFFSVFLDFSPPPTPSPPSCKEESQMVLTLCQDSLSDVPKVWITLWGCLYLTIGCRGRWGRLLQVWNGQHPVRNGGVSCKVTCPEVCSRFALHTEQLNCSEETGSPSLSFSDLSCTMLGWKVRKLRKPNFILL